MIPHSIRRATAVLVATSLAGCYVQQPIGTALPAPESRLVAQLTDLGSEQMAQMIGPAAYEVEGDVYVVTADTIKLLMRRVEHRGGMSATWRQELVAFPRAALTGVSVKRFSRGRSWFAAGAFVVGSFLLTRLIGATTSGIPDPGGVIEPS